MVETGAPLVQDAAPREIFDGATWGEGPLWLPTEQILIWSDIPGCRILFHDPATGTSGVRRDGPDVEFTNGRALHPQLGVVQCSHGRRAVEVQDVTGPRRTRVLVDRFGSARLNSPNDIAVAPDGALWFTDPPYGIIQAHEGHLGDPEYGGCFVFRWSPEDGLVPVITRIDRPNGIAFSPDGRTVYVTDTSRVLEEGQGHHIWTAELEPDGRSIREDSLRVLAQIDPGWPDGIAVDAEGRIWTSAGDGIRVLDAHGEEIDRIDLGGTVSNLTFGGPAGTDLYITAGARLLSLPTTTRSS